MTLGRLHCGDKAPHDDHYWYDPQYPLFAPGTIPYHCTGKPPIYDWAKDEAAA